MGVRVLLATGAIGIVMAIVALGYAASYPLMPADSIDAPPVVTMSDGPLSSSILDGESFND